MSFKAINSFSETNLLDFINGTDSLYIKDINIYLKHFGGIDSYIIKDVTNALKTGAVCNRYSITSDAPSGNLIITNWIEWKFGGDITKLVDYLKTLDFKKDGYGNFIDVIRRENDENCIMTISKCELKSINTYSPFNHANIKPLTAIPAKWTMRHAVKAILNGHFDNLRCNGVLTDDYANDAAVNFREGTINDSTAFIKRIIESPSGWWTMLDGNSVKLCCHNFDSNSFTLNTEKNIAEK